MMPNILRSVPIPPAAKQAINVVVPLPTLTWYSHACTLPFPSTVTQPYMAKYVNCNSIRLQEMYFKLRYLSLSAFGNCKVIYSTNCELLLLD